jgi:NAD(P)H dehydrogenase (quinone)
MQDLNKLGAQVADFGWDREETYEHALKDVKSVLCTVAYQKDWQQHFPVFLRACVKAGVKHFVKISFYHARKSGDQFQEVPLVKAHGDCDEMLVKLLTPQAFGAMDVGVDFTTPHMSYTILYASHFMSNPFVFQGKELRESGSLATFYGASANKGVNYVSPNDVAEVAVRVLLEPCQYYNKEYTLTGPAAITDQQVADLIGKHLKKPVMYVDQPLREFQAELRYGGIEEDKEFVTSDVETICGHKAQTFEDYLQQQDMMTKLEVGAEGELKPLKEVEA